MKKVTEKKSKKMESTQSQGLYSGDDMKRYMGALTENFNDKIGAVAEQVGGLYEKINGVEERLTKKIDVHTEMIGHLMIDVEEIKSGMHEKINRDEFTKLEKRMVALEAYIFTERGKKPASHKK